MLEFLTWIACFCLAAFMIAGTIAIIALSLDALNKMTKTEVGSVIRKLWPRKDESFKVTVYKGLCPHGIFLEECNFCLEEIKKKGVGYD